MSASAQPERQLDLVVRLRRLAMRVGAEPAEELRHAAQRLEDAHWSRSDDMPERWRLGVDLLCQYEPTHGEGEV